MTIELVGQHLEVANDARERIRAGILAPLMQAAITATEIFQTPNPTEEA